MSRRLRGCLVLIAVSLICAAAYILPRGDIRDLYPSIARELRGQFITSHAPSDSGYRVTVIGDNGEIAVVNVAPWMALQVAGSKTLNPKMQVSPPYTIEGPATVYTSNPRGGSVYRNMAQSQAVLQTESGRIRVERNSEM